MGGKSHCEINAFSSSCRDSHGKRLILCSVTHFCVYFDVCFGLLSWWKIQTRPIIGFIFVINIFLFFSHITQHSIQNITKQNNRHILNISKSSQKGGREGRTTKTQKSLLHIITYIKQKTLPSINGRRPGPSNSRRCTFTSHYLQEATDPICFSTHVWCKPVLDYCLLHSCKTSKQYSLIQRPESSLRRHKLGLTDQSIRSKDDKTRFTCVRRLMTTGHSQNIWRKVPADQYYIYGS